MRQLHNDLIVSPDDGCLLGDRNANKNDVITTQLRLMIDNHRMVWGCAICNTSKYFQESLNTWRRKQLKIMKDKSDHSRGR